MTLLTAVTARPLDGGYEEAARRRAAGEEPKWTGRVAFVLSMALVLGLAVTLGVRDLTAPDEADQRVRQGLERNASESQERVDELRGRNRELSTEVEALANQALALADPSAAVQARNLAIRAGSMAVSGPGLKVEISPDQEAIAAGDTNARITAGDLRVIVSALWAGGAEAVSINSVRLSAKTSIRDVGGQIQVGFQPLASPFVVEAIGSQDSLELALAKGRAGDRIALLRGVLGADVRVRREGDLRLEPSTEVGSLDHAQPVPKDAVSTAHLQ
jgi:uncharacterized protein YlxW (UPF0749 family)